MIVAVESSLEDIKIGLEQRGYQVVDLGSHPSVDAIVYYNNGKTLEHGEGKMQQDFSLIQGDTSKETFLVNANNKGIDEIDQMLQRRSYSPLFGNFQ